MRWPIERAYWATQRADQSKMPEVPNHRETLADPGYLEIIEGQAYEPTDPRAIATAPSAALPGQDPARDTLPVPCDEARKMPAARRRARDRRTKR